MLQPQRRTEIPEMTELVAKIAFPKGSIFMTLCDELGPIFEDERFAYLYPGTGQPSESPTQWAMVTIMQFLGNLTDRQAADAVRGRIDCKYGLGLELTDPGFHYSVLSEFRQRLVNLKAYCWTCYSSSVKPKDCLAVRRSSARIPFIYCQPFAV